MRLLAIVAAISATLAACAAAKSDATGVSFYARTTAMQAGAPVEFLIVGPDSDHAYEALFTTEEPVEEIVRRLRAAGFAGGRPIDVESCRLWPVGEAVEISPSLAEVTAQPGGKVEAACIYTGGKGCSGGMPEACTNMPQAVFALYDCPQSLFQLDGIFPQSPTYGRFTAISNTAAGARVRFSVRHAAEPAVQPIEIAFSMTNCTRQIERLQTAAERGPVDLLATFSADLTLREAAGIATLLAQLDSTRIKLNGAGAGDFFYQAFLPKEQWRERSERLMQPPEVHLDAKGRIRIVEVKEDWSDPDTIDPKLTLREHQCADAVAAAKLAGELAGKTRTVLFFAPASTALGSLQAIKRQITAPILNYYVFAE